MARASRQEFKELFKTIKTIGTSNISQNDKSILIDFLKSLKYICEFDILKSCYDHNESFKSLIPDIETKIMELKQEITNLNNKQDLGELLTVKEQNRLKVALMSYKRYCDIKNAIQQRDFEHYVNSMSKNINNANQIIAACSSVLYNADVDYLKEFNINGENVSPLDIIEKLKEDKVLLQDVLKYFRIVDRFKSGADRDLEVDQEYLRYIRLCKEHEELLRDYMLLIRKTGTSEQDKEIIVRDRLTRNKLEYQTQSESILNSIRHARNKTELMNQISNDERELVEIQAAKSRLSDVTNKLREVGLGPIIDEFNYSFKDSKGTIEQKIVDYVRAGMTKNGLDVSRIESNLVARIEEESKEKDRLDLITDSHVRKMSKFGQDLVTKYPKETLKLLDVVNEKVTDDITPVFAAFLLKGIMMAQGLSYEDINDVIRLYDKAGIEALVESCERIVSTTTYNINDNLVEIYNHDNNPEEHYGGFKIA